MADELGFCGALWRDLSTFSSHPWRLRSSVEEEISRQKHNCYFRMHIKGVILCFLSLCHYLQCGTFICYLSSIVTISFNKVTANTWRRYRYTTDNAPEELLWCHAGWNFSLFGLCLCVPPKKTTGRKRLKKKNVWKVEVDLLGLGLQGSSRSDSFRFSRQRQVEASCPRLSHFSNLFFFSRRSSGLGCLIGRNKYSKN
jgi:hypothetical protein